MATKAKKAKKQAPLAKKKVATDRKPNREEVLAHDVGLERESYVHAECGSLTCSVALGRVGPQRHAVRGHHQRPGKLPR